MEKTVHALISEAAASLMIGAVAYRVVSVSCTFGGVSTDEV